MVRRESMETYGESSAMADKQRDQVRRDFAHAMGLCDSCEKAMIEGSSMLDEACCRPFQLSFDDFQWAWFAGNAMDK